MFHSTLILSREVDKTCILYVCNLCHLIIFLILLNVSQFNSNFYKITSDKLSIEKNLHTIFKLTGHFRVYLKNSNAIMTILK